MVTEIRTFVAIDVPEEVRQEIRDFQAPLKRMGADVKWVRPESIHITLKFLGNVAENRVGEITEALAGCVSGIAPFRVIVAGTGMFPGAQLPRVLWVGVKDGAEALSVLASRIDESLSGLGFDREKRKYSAHLTIGRVRSPRGFQPVAEAICAATFEAGVVGAGEIVLVKSDLKPTGAVYTALERIKLRG